MATHARPSAQGGGGPPAGEGPPPKPVLRADRAEDQAHNRRDRAPAGARSRADDAASGVLAMGVDPLSHGAKRLAGMIPGARLVPVPEAGHLVQEDAPESVVAAILSDRP